jgi:hypothetical protein
MKKVIYILIAILVIIQFIPSGRTANQPEAGKDLHEHLEVTDEVSTLLRNACYDCHSQEVKYPWYSYVAPVSFLVARDVNIGREHLDFSNWGNLDIRKQLKALDEISDEIKNENMPLPIYPPLHPEARLTDKEREKIIRWAGEAAEYLLD